MQITQNQNNTPPPQLEKDFISRETKDKIVIITIFALAVLAMIAVGVVVAVMPATSIILLGGAHLAMTSVVAAPALMSLMAPAGLSTYLFGAGAILTVSVGIVAALKYLKAPAPPPVPLPAPPLQPAAN